MCKARHQFRSSNQIAPSRSTTSRRIWVYLRLLCPYKATIATPTSLRASSALAFNSAGGRGCISAAANVMPRLCTGLQSAWHSSDATAAHALQGLLVPLTRALALEPSPGPVKYALSRLRGMRNELRLPLVPVEPATAKEISQAIDSVVLAERASLDDFDLRVAQR